MSKFKSALNILTIPITSKLGYLRINYFSLKQDKKVWEKSFCNKRVLIVGTGPSLDKVDQEYFSKFDTIIYINHAVKIADSKKEQYFFTTDINVMLDIYNLPYFKIIEKIGNDKCIIAPGNFDQSLFLKNEIIGRFSWISAGSAVYKKYQSDRSVLGIRPIAYYYRPEEIDVEKLDLWFSQKNQVKYFPIFEKTSALTAIVFIAKYAPKNINLIGCDFSDGRSLSIIENNKPNLTNVFQGAIELFFFLENYFSHKNITLKNDSWHVK